MTQSPASGQGLEISGHRRPEPTRSPVAARIFDENGQGEQVFRLIQCAVDSLAAQPVEHRDGVRVLPPRSG